MIREDGLIRAIKILVRLVLLVLSTSILITLTTTPILIADAIENLLGPLKRLASCSSEISMMMSIALPLFTLLDEMQKIMKAQSSRGADYDTGNALKRARGFVSTRTLFYLFSFDVLMIWLPQWRPDVTEAAKIEPG